MKVAKTAPSGEGADREQNIINTERSRRLLNANFDSDELFELSFDPIGQITEERIEPIVNEQIF